MSYFRHPKANTPIVDMDERTLIEVILSMYTNDEKAIKQIAVHLADRLSHRRGLLRKRKKAA